MDVDAIKKHPLVSAIRGNLERTSLYKMKEIVHAVVEKVNHQQWTATSLAAVVLTNGKIPTMYQRRYVGLH